jgi:hypothetical protein
VRPFLKKTQNTHLKTSADKMWFEILICVSSIGRLPSFI